MGRNGGYPSCQRHEIVAVSGPDTPFRQIQETSRKYRAGGPWGRARVRESRKQARNLRGSPTPNSTDSLSRSPLPTSAKTICRGTRAATGRRSSP